MSWSRRQALVAGGLLAASAAAPACASARRRKIDLWDNASGPHLRGATFVQRRVYPQIDGPSFLGPGPVGAPVTDAAIASLAEAGANFALLSQPGVYSEADPYALDAAVEDHLADLVDRCEAAGLFTVIGYRSGPGRSEFTFHRDSGGDWFPASMIDESVWASYAAQDAWVAMWRATAARFYGRRSVAGYLLMVEPNANLAAPGPRGGDLNEWDPERLAARVAGTPADWPAFALRMARAIREVDGETPVLISPDGYAGGRFAGLVDPGAVANAVLAVHDYSPRDYTHQDRGAGIRFRPGEAAYAPPPAVSRQPRWMMGEFGPQRWALDADRYVAERLASLELAGANSALFRWDSGWRVFEARENGFNPVYGSAPGASSPDPAAPMVAALRTVWARNRLRP